MIEDKYNLSNFIEDQQPLINADNIDLKQLQTVFENLCRINDAQRYQSN
jgi:hypothetical protein